MSLKMEFVERAAKGEPVAALCREFNVSRQTGHKWIKRFNEQGFAGLDEQSRRPKSAPLATAEELVMATLQAREAHPRWGPIKLQQLLRRRFGDQTPGTRTENRQSKRGGSSGGESTERTFRRCSPSCCRSQRKRGLTWRA
jgi:putative transposase